MKQFACSRQTAKCLFCAESLVFLAKSRPLGPRAGCFHAYSKTVVFCGCFCFVAIIHLDNYSLTVSVPNILTASQSRINLILNVLWLVSCLLHHHIVSCNVSCLEHLNYVSCLVLSQPSLTCLGSSCVSTPVSWQMSLSRKNLSTPSLHASQWLITIPLSPTIYQLFPSNMKNHRFHRKSVLAPIGLCLLAYTECVNM